MGAPGERRLRRGDGGGENVFHWIARLRFVALALSCVERQFYAQNAVESNPRARRIAIDNFAHRKKYN